jgi:hypothetical protein
VQFKPWASQTIGREALYLFLASAIAASCTTVVVTE